METFLTVILIIFLGFWLMGAVGRWALRRWVNQTQKRFSEQGFDPTAAGGRFWGNAGSRANRSQRPEGEVTITREAPAEPHVSSRVGEYVEFEEEVGSEQKPR